MKLPEHTDYEIGKYGRVHLAYLKKHCRGTYSQLVVECRLNEYLHEIDVQAQEMNNIRDTAEEVVMREIVVAKE